MNPKKSLLLLSFGLFTICGVQIISHFTKISDFGLGILSGIGFGLMLLSFLLKKFKTG